LKKSRWVSINQDVGYAVSEKEVFNI